MTAPDHPSLEAQIAAVELAIERMRQPKPMAMREAERAFFVARLEAGDETLRTLEFGRATLR